MLLKRMLLSAVYGGLASFAAGSANSAVLNYDYLGAPATVSNLPARPLFNTGSLTVDTGKLDPGQSLAGLTVQFFPASPSGPEIDVNADIVTSFDFALGTGDTDFGSALLLKFDAVENLAEWSFGSVIGIEDFSANLYGVGDSGEVYEPHEPFPGPPFFDTASNRAHSVLTNLGYRPGTAAYQDLFCGSWVSETETCNPDGGASRAWQQDFRADAGGIWIKEDPLAFAALVEEATNRALANPPASYHDIAAIPVPAPLLLLGGGLAALVMVGRRRAA